MRGRLSIIGLGPGDARWLTPEAEVALARAQALYGYGSYLDRVPPRSDQARHPSGNREESARAVAALCHAANGLALPDNGIAPETLDKSRGCHVALVCGGDPGVFAMAAAVCAEIERGPAGWRDIELEIIPGITAMLAVAARAGAPLGHDFCALSLSDNLKPWELIERRLDAAAAAGFAIALYNPISLARPWQLMAAFERLGQHLPASCPVVFGRAVGRAEELVSTTTLAAARRGEFVADMATLVIIGTAETRVIPRDGQPPLVYTPRGAVRRA